MVSENVNRPDGTGAGRQAAKSSIADPRGSLPAASQPRMPSANSCLDAILVCAGGKCVFANPAAARVFGAASPQEMVGREVRDLIHPDYRRSVGQRLRHAGRGAVTTPQAATLLRLDGHRFDAELMGARVLLDRRPATEIVLRDLTERNRAEQALRDSEQRLRTFIQQSLDGIILIDAQGKIIEWNDAEEQITGIPRSQALGRPLWEIQYQLMPQEKRTNAFLQTARQKIFDGLKEGAVLKRTLEDELLRPDGTRRIVQSMIFAVPSGETLLAAGICRDITERKRMEAQLRQLNESLEQQVAQRTQELTHTVDRLQDEVARHVMAEGKVRKHAQMLEGLFRHTMTPLAFMDCRFNFMRVNEAYARADGKDPEYFVGKNYFALYPDETQRAVFEQVMQTGQPYRAYAGPLPHFGDPKRGAKYWNWQFTPLLSKTGTVQFLVFSLQDVTEQQKALQEAQERTRQLQQLTLELSQAEDRERKRIADILHDDIQQVLAAAKFHLGLLSTGAQNADQLRQIVEEVKQMLKDAIEKSRSLSHELSPALYEVDLCEMLRWLAGHMEQRHGLTVRVEARGPVNARSEPLRVFLFKTAQELLFNVVKHARVKQAEVRVRRMGRYVCLSVADRGQGFDARRLQEATGFGLATIRQRVQLLGGRMKVRSKPGEGTRFLIVVPDEEAAVAPG